MDVADAATRVARTFAVVGITALSWSCVTSVHPYLPDLYYEEGAEVALDVLQTFGVSRQMRVLAGMEASSMWLELGDYPRSREAARSARRELLAAAQTGGPAAGALYGRDGTFLGQPFERRWLATVAALASLALQDAEAASGDAADILSQQSACAGCEDLFSRYVAAISLAAAGRPSEAVAATAHGAGAGPGAEVLAAERVRVGARDELAASLRYLPPPHEAGRRRLVVLLLLGQGPVKTLRSEGGAPVWEDGSSTTVAADLLTPGTRVERSTVLTDLAELARSELAAVGPESLSSDARGTWVGSLGEVFLPHWTTLPATAQVILAELDRSAEWVELRYLAGSGRGVSTEVIELPADWTSGPLFVVRRVP